LFQVWNHFITIEEKLFCVHCRNENVENRIQCGYSLKSSTGNLAKHLYRKHNIDIQNISVNDENETSEQCQEAITLQLIKHIVVSKSPFNIVENQTFIDLCKVLNKDYIVPSRRTIIRSIESEYDILEVKMKHIFTNPHIKLALTCDGWSSRKFKGYFVITAHWIDDEWELKSIILDFKYFPPPHNCTNTANLIMGVVNKYNISQKIISVTTDNGSEMKPALEFVRTALITHFNADIHPEWHVRCTCHIINLMVKDLTASIRDEIEKVREVIKYIRMRPEARELFKVTQESTIINGVIYDIPHLDVDTRWNSTFVMLNQAFKLKNIFETMKNKYDIDQYHISSEVWEKINCYVTFLEVAKQFTEMASGSNYVTGSLSPIIYDMLKNHCEDTISKTNDPGFIFAINAMLIKLQKYEFTLCGYLPKLALVIDPRIPSNNPLKVEMKDTLKMIIRDKYSYKPSTNINIAPSSSTSNVSKTISSYNYLKSGSTIVPSDGDEVDEFYIFTTFVESHINPLLWWKDIGASRFPNIAKLAKHTCMIMGSSVPSESAFSDSGDIVTPERSSLTDTNIESLMKLRSWYKYQETLKGTFYLFSD